MRAHARNGVDTTTTTEHQARFRHGRSTEDQLLRLSQSISDGFQQSPLLRAIVAHIVCSRAYSKVWRDALLMRMSHKGIPSQMVWWIQAWLSNHLTRVTFDEFRCRTVTLKQGIPQGWVLLPLLFLFCIEDLAAAVGLSQVSFCADDVAVLTQDTGLERATSKLQKGLDAVKSWSMKWKIELSA